MTLKEFVLQTRPLFESHTAKNLSNVLKKAVDDWKIVRCYKSLTGNLVEKPIAITTDNAANFVKLKLLKLVDFLLTCAVLRTV